jgi:hypothetical protein
MENDEPTDHLTAAEHFIQGFSFRDRAYMEALCAIAQAINRVADLIDRTTA